MCVSPRRQVPPGPQAARSRRCAAHQSLGHGEPRRMPNARRGLGKSSLQATCCPGRKPQLETNKTLPACRRSGRGYTTAKEPHRDVRIHAGPARGLRPSSLLGACDSPSKIATKSQLSGKEEITYFIILY